MRYTLLILSMIIGSACYGQVRVDSNLVFQRERDTVLVFAMVTDTTHFIEPYSGWDSVSMESDSIEIHFWLEGRKANFVDWGLPPEVKTYATYLYSVRELHNTSELMEAGNTNCINEDGEIVACKWDYWKHIMYLDKNKQPLSKNIVVWMTK